MEYHSDTGNFYIVIDHNSLCDQKNINAWEDYKKLLITHLNNNPLLSLFSFKKYAIKKFLNIKNFEFPLKKVH